MGASGQSNRNSSATGDHAEVEETVSGSVTSQELTDVTDLIGKFGPWQRNLFLMFFFGIILSPWHNLVLTFLAPNMDYWCSPPEQFSNLTRQQWLNISWPLDKRPNEVVKKQLEQCHMYDLSHFDLEEARNLTNNFSTVASITNETNRNVIECEKFEFDKSIYSRTLMSEFSLVCDRNWLISLTQTLYMLGILTSVLVFGHLSDRFGRRAVMLLSNCILLISGISCALSGSLTQFAAFRYFSALGSAGFYGTGFVLVLEPVGPEYRTILGIAINFGWCIGYIALPGIAYLLRNWLYIQLTITLPAVLYIGYYWILPESPRWLLANGRLSEAETLLRKAAKKNGRELSDEFKNTLRQLQEKALSQLSLQEDIEKRYSILDLFKTPNLRRKTLILYFTWLVNSFIYYGLSLNTNELGGDPFFNFFLAGAVEIPSYIICIFVLKYYGRRLPESCALILGGIACLLIIPIDQRRLWLRITLAMVGKFCITASYGIIYLYSAELFPTVVRTIGVGSSSMCARIGSSLAPFVKELGRATHPSFPLTIFGGLSIASGLLVLLLPETNGVGIPDTIEEAEEFGKKKSPPSPVTEEQRPQNTDHEGAGAA